ncbi:DUF998 domain-containing protein [Sphingomonas sp. 2378]|uniref:DUF998 domain-containing protein n=1 Tax=Sphingomonas sp. 2378 TaxID=1219748 RepID=UPI00311B3B06
MAKIDTTTMKTMISAGILPLPWFIIWVTIGGMFMPGYSWISQHASEMTLVPGTANVLLKIGAFGTGVFFILFAVGLWRYSDRKISWGSICWIVFGFSMLSNGIWNMGDPKHGFYAIGIINIVTPALSLAENRKLADDRIVYFTTIAVRFSGILYLWLNVTGNDPEGYRGISQRLFSSINSLWPMVVAWRVIANDRMQMRG